MSRNQTGGFNKFLNFIGIVDDDRYDDRAESFNSGSYGRPAAYTPNNRQRPDNRAASQQGARRSIPAQGGRSNYGASNARRPYDDDARYNSTRRSARFEDDNRDFAPQQRQVRARSRFEEEDNTENFNAPAPAPARRPAPNTGSTVMFPVHTLTDVNPVIKSLIRGDSIVMTLEAEDSVMERRILDTLAGAVFALDATFRKPSKNSNTYFLAPKSVSIKSAYELED